TKDRDRGSSRSPASCEQATWRGPVAALESDRSAGAYCGSWYSQLGQDGGRSCDRRRGNNLHGLQGMAARRCKLNPRAAVAVAVVSEWDSIRKVGRESWR